MRNSRSREQKRELEKRVSYGAGGMSAAIEDMPHCRRAFSPRPATEFDTRTCGDCDMDVAGLENSHSAGVALLVTPALKKAQKTSLHGSYAAGSYFPPSNTKLREVHFFVGVYAFRNAWLPMFVIAIRRLADKSCSVVGDRRCRRKDWPSPSGERCQARSAALFARVPRHQYSSPAPIILKPNGRLTRDSPCTAGGEQSASVSRTPQ